MVRFLVKKNDNLKLRVKVITRSNNNSISGIINNELNVKIKALPEKGKANMELITFFAEHLGISKAQAVICSGKKSQHKTIVLPASCYENLLQLIKKYK